MKRIISAVISLLLIAVMTAACGSGAEKSTESGTNDTTASSGGINASASGEKVTLSLWVLDNDLWVDKAVKDFMDQNPNITVEVVKYGVDPIKEALKVAASSKTLPDIWFTWGGSLGSFYPENGLTMDLTQIAKEHNWAEKYNQAAIDMTTFNGKVSGIPYNLNVLDMWYSKDVYEKLGLQPPTSFEEFESQLQQIKDANVIPMAFGGKNGWHIMRLVEQLLEKYAGPELHDKLNNLESSWKDPAVIQTFAKLKEYSDKGYFPKGHVAIDQAEAINSFYPGKAAMSIEGPWLDSSITAAGFDPRRYGVFKFPTGRVSVFAEMFQINGSLDQAKQEAAVKFGEYITSAEVVNKYIDEYGTPAALNVKFSEKTPNIQALMELANSGGFLITDQALPQEVAQKLFEAQDKVALNEWTPEQAAEAMDKAIADFKSKK